MMTTEHAVEELRTSLNEIKATLKDIETDVRVDIKAIFNRLSDFSRDMQEIMTKIDERDKYLRESNINVSQTFARFGDNIEMLKNKQHAIDLEVQKIRYLEKIIYGQAIAIIGMFGWLLERTVGNLF